MQRKIYRLFIRLEGFFSFRPWKTRQWSEFLLYYLITERCKNGDKRKGRIKVGCLRCELDLEKERKEKRKLNNYIRMISTISNKEHLFSFSIEKYIWVVILCLLMIYKTWAIGFGKVAHIILAGTSYPRSYCLIFRYSYLCCCMTLASEQKETENVADNSRV